MKFMFYFLAVFWLLSMTSAPINAEVGDKDKNKAWEIYEKARKTFSDAEDLRKNKSLCADLEEHLLEAISIVPGDTEALRYKLVERRLVPGKGRWVEYEDIDVPYTKKYYPNRLLSKVRKKNPPAPWAVVNIIDNNAGGQSILVEILNRGETGMDNVEALIKNDFWRYSKTKTISSLEPGQRKQLKWDVSRVGNLRVRFAEKFNYIPVKMQTRDF